MGASSTAARLTGIDVARAVAILGMYAVHVGPDPRAGGFRSLFAAFDGRSTALFAVLAGVSLALMTGGRAPRTGRAGRVAALRVGARAPLLVLLGLALTALDTGYLVILAYYGVCFVLVLPVRKLGARGLAIAAGLAATLLPFASYVLRFLLAPRDLVTELPDVTFEQFTSLAGVANGAVVLLLTGTFPAFGLLAYLLAGMAIGRLDLTSPRVRRGLLGGGTALAALAYGSSWLVTGPLGGMNLIYEQLAPQAEALGTSPQEFYAANVNLIHGTPPTTTPAWELVAAPHSYTPFDLAGCIGVAAAVVGACLLLGDRFARALRPLADLGSVALTAYAGHLVAIWLIWPEESTFRLVNLALFGVSAVGAAMAWRRWVGRGPLEWLLHAWSRRPADWYRQRVAPARAEPREYARR